MFWIKFFFKMISKESGLHKKIDLLTSKWRFVGIWNFVIAESVRLKLRDLNGPYAYGCGIEHRLQNFFRISKIPSGSWDIFKKLFFSVTPCLDRVAIFFFGPNKFLNCLTSITIGKNQRSLALESFTLKIALLCKWFQPCLDPS